MASTYVNDLRIEEQATGENSGTWGTKVNSAFSQIAEAFSYGTKQLAADSNETFTMPDGTSDGTRSLYLKITSAGSLTATRTVTLGPNTVSKLWIIENATTGSQSITIAQGSGGTVTIPTGAVKMVYSDGAGSGAAVVDALTDVYLASVDHAAFGDNKKAVFGAGSDLQIYHTGTYSLIADTSGTGPLRVVTNTFQLNNAADTQNMISAAEGGAVTLYNAGSAKLATTSTGIDVTGTVTSDGLTVDGDVTVTGASAISLSSEQHITYQTTSTNATAGDHIFKSYNTEIMRIDGNNNRVGIGTASPDTKLHLSDAGTPELRLESTDASVVSGQSLGDITWESNDVSGGGQGVRAKISALAENAGTIYGLAFYTGTGADPTEKFRIANDGSISTPTAGTGNVRFGVNAGKSFTSSGNYNVVVGDDALDDATSASNNVAIGYGSMADNTTGSNNVALGYNALLLNIAASDNTAVGHQSLASNQSGTGSTAAGYRSLYYSTGSQNTAFGADAGRLITSGVYNVAIGPLVMDNSAGVTGSQNVAIGRITMRTLTSGSDNTAVGNSALTAVTTGSTNVAIGSGALLSNTTASNNVAVGYQALTANTTGAENAAVGALAGDALTTGLSNTALGYKSLSSDTTGRYSVAIGHSALENQNFTGNNEAYNVAVGYSAGNDITTGIQNVLIGGLAGDALLAASDNTAVGYAALTAETGGQNNVAVGTSALQNQVNSSGNIYNTAVGSKAGQSVSSGIKNTFVGGLSADATTVGSDNVAVGFEALTTNQGGAGNVAIGAEALETMNPGASSTATYNTAVGAKAGKAITTGTENTIVGALAGDAMTTGSSNTFIGNTAAGTGVVTGQSNTAVGKSAGLNLSSGGNNTLLGHDAGITGSPGGNVTTNSHAIVLGDENILGAHIQVDWTVASDERDKTDFTALDLGLDFVKALEPLTYKWDKRSKYGDKYAEDYDLAAQTPDGTHKEDWLDIGFKAQAVEALEIAAGYTKETNTNLVSSHSSDGKQMGLQYSKFVPILVKAIQEQQDLIDSLTARIAALESN